MRLLRPLAYCSRRKSLADSDFACLAHCLDGVEYIHLNPVRQGLVATPEAWIWSSAAEFSGVSPEGTADAAA